MNENSVIKDVLDEYNKSSKSLNDAIKVIDVVRMKSNIAINFKDKYFSLSNVSYTFWSQEISGRSTCYISPGNSLYHELFEIWLLANLDNLRQTTLDNNILVGRIKSIVEGLK